MRILTTCNKCSTQEYVDTADMGFREDRGNLQYTISYVLVAQCENCGSPIDVAIIEEQNYTFLKIILGS